MSSVAFSRKGELNHALTAIGEACQLEPDNEHFRSAAAEVTRILEQRHNSAETETNAEGGDDVSKHEHADSAPAADSPSNTATAEPGATTHPGRDATNDAVAAAGSLEEVPSAHAQAAYAQGSQVQGGQAQPGQTQPAQTHGALSSSPSVASPPVPPASAGRQRQMGITVRLQSLQTPGEHEDEEDEPLYA